MTSTLVLLRHGRSDWNDRNLFTGWVDADLSERGVDEARRAGELMGGRAPPRRGAHLRARPGDPHGVDRPRRHGHDLAAGAPVVAAERAPLRRPPGQGQEGHGRGVRGRPVKIWRRSYDIRPPDIEPGSEFDVAGDPRYRELPPHVVPRAECLKDTLERTLPYWEDAIVPDLRAGRVVLVAAHGNSLRALVKHLDGISDDAITELNIPTGNPLVYELDDSLTPVSSATSTRSGRRRRRRGRRPSRLSGTTTRSSLPCGLARTALGRRSRLLAGSRVATFVGSLTEVFYMAFTFWKETRNAPLF